MNNSYVNIQKPNQFMKWEVGHRFDQDDGVYKYFWVVNNEVIYEQENPGVLLWHGEETLKSGQPVATFTSSPFHRSYPAERMFDKNRNNFSYSQAGSNNYMVVSFEEPQTIGQIRIYKRKRRLNQFNLCFILLDESDIETDRHCCEDEYCTEFVDSLDNELLKVNQIKMNQSF